MADLTSFILNLRYLNEGETTWEDICKRVSSAVYPEIYQDMLSKKFIPAGRTLATVGTRFNVVPNCVTIDLEDDLADIFETMRRLMELTRRGSGIGMNFSKLRPAKSIAKQFAAISSGPVAFLNMLSIVMKTVQQQKRHGAFIGILRIDHPDILSFIHVKQDLTKISNFNLSVLITDEFLKHLKETPDAIVKANYSCTHSDGTVEHFYKLHYITYDDNFVATDVTDINMTYRELMQEVIHCAWNTGEPGVLFEDNMNVDNELIRYLGKMNCTNPCGEITMYQNECCNLGSINLDAFTDDIDYDTLDTNLTPSQVVINNINLKDLYDTTMKATYFLDNMIDIIQTDDEKVDKFLKTTRRLGLGVMGLHDMLIKLKVPYDTEFARDIVGIVMSYIKKASYEASKKLLAKRGSVIDRLRSNGYIKYYFNDCPNLESRANIALMTIAPNGSTAMIPNVSAGVEPYFSLGYYRLVNNSTSKTDLIVNPKLKDWLVRHDLYTDERMRAIIMEGINASDLPQYIKNVFKTSQSIAPEDHIRMQATAQEYVDNSISKTINLPRDATEHDVMIAFMMAHDLGIKGTTVFRDGCREGVLITANDKRADEKDTVDDKNELKDDATEVMSRSLSKDSCRDGHCDI